MKLRILFGLSLAVPVLAARPMAPVEELTFLPKEGLVVTKSSSMTWQTEQTSSSEDQGPTHQALDALLLAFTPACPESAPNA